MAMMLAKVMQNILNYHYGQKEKFKMAKILIIFVALLLSGCAGMSIGPPERWVENNTMYSTKLPSIEVKVMPSLIFKISEKTDGITESTRGNAHTGKDIDWFYFVNDSKKIRLNIKIETLTAHTRWYMEKPDYSQDSKSLLSNHETIGGIDFATGLLRDKYHGAPVMIKAFGAVVGETTRYQLFYMEKVNDEWLQKYVALLSTDDHNFISEFNKRANESFSIISYSGLLPPSKRRK